MAIATIHEARFVLFDDNTRLACITSFDGERAECPRLPAADRRLRPRQTDVRRRCGQARVTAGTKALRVEGI
jgi:hypothetical protein